MHRLQQQVATVLTVYAIETTDNFLEVFKEQYKSCNSTYRLRYWNSSRPKKIHKPLKGCNSTYRLRYWNELYTSSTSKSLFIMLQQYLPFTLLKRQMIDAQMLAYEGCNSTYRLRYWNVSTSTPVALEAWMLQQYLPFMLLKLAGVITLLLPERSLQQYLPFTLLKLCFFFG